MRRSIATAFVASALMLPACSETPKENAAATEVAAEGGTEGATEAVPAEGGTEGAAGAVAAEGGSEGHSDTTAANAANASEPGEGANESH